MEIELLAKLILFLPLFSGLVTSFLRAKSATFFSTAILVATSAITWFLFFQIAITNQISPSDYKIFTWIASLGVDWAVSLDPLTLTMMVVVTTVSALVHLYSIGYMAKDEGLPRFMAYLSLFTFAMLALVSASNMLQLFFGWEGVGLCSYLLIGFWFRKKSASDAAIKAFLVNRVGDIGLLIAMALMLKFCGTLQFSTLFAAKNLHEIVVGNWSVADLIAITLLFGAMGKSAQIGLHIWLADAMEGPTPVSALIHAATMVTAGVFLLVRCSPIFVLSEFAMNMTVVIGAATAIGAASIALVQTDIKKIIAYSTCSQLGYMFFAIGLGGFGAAIFHLATHAFFKALLFLGAGSVIHGFGGEQNIMKMGGARRAMPYTFCAMLIGSLAITGIPPLAGFFSKDAILEIALEAGGVFGHSIFAIGVFTALLTAFYSFRLFILVFDGRSRSDAHLHESPKTMVLPLLLLSIGAIFSGMIGHYYLGMDDNQSWFWQNNLAGEALLAKRFTWMNYIPIIFVLIGIAAAYIIYYKKIIIPASAIQHLLLHKYFIDEIYWRFIIMPTRRLALWLWRTIDILIIDFSVNKIAHSVRRVGISFSHLQTGLIYHYNLMICLGLCAILSWLL